jgi:hypothetical protein
VAGEAVVVALARRERGEVVRAGERRGARAQARLVDPVGPPQRAAALERGRGPAREDPVEVLATAGIVAGGEPLGRLDGLERGDLRRQQRVERAQPRQRPWVGDDLAERMDAAVRAPGDRQRDVAAQQDRERAPELTRDRPPPGLCRPAGERRPVVLQEQAGRAQTSSR